MKSKHEKVCKIVHKNTNLPQNYLTNGSFSNAQKSLLFNLRSQCENNFKDNFHNMHDNNICPHCKQGPDSQKHAFSCTVIAKHLSQVDKEAMQDIIYEDIYGDSQAQLLITQVYQSIISIKKRLLKSGLPGH